MCFSLALHLSRSADLGAGWGCKCSVEVQHRLGTRWGHARFATAQKLLKSAEQIVRLVMAVNRHGIPKQQVKNHNTKNLKTPVTDAQAMSTDPHTLIP